MSRRFDPSLLYAECRRCGAPALWFSDPAEDLLWMGIPAPSLDADCLLLYDGCPNCSPGKPRYEPSFVRFGRRAGRPYAN
jgi:hypothetical protein